MILHTTGNPRSKEIQEHLQKSHRSSIITIQHRLIKPANNQIRLDAIPNRLITVLLCPLVALCVRRRRWYWWHTLPLATNVLCWDVSTVNTDGCCVSSWLLILSWTSPLKQSAAACLHLTELLGTGLSADFLKRSFIKRFLQKYHSKKPN